MKLKSILTAILLCASTAFAAENIGIFEYTGYDDPSYYPTYMKKYGKPNFSIMVTAEEALQKVLAGYKVNLAHPCSIDMGRWIKSGYIEPWDKSRLKNWNQMSPFWRDNQGFIDKDGKVWGVPYDLFLTGLNVNADMVDVSKIKSLEILMDPAYKGKIAFPDEWSDAYGAAFAIMGITDQSKVNEETLDKASAILRKIVPNVKFFWSIGDTDVIPPLKSKEIAMAWAWNSVAYTGGNEGAKLAFLRDLGFIGASCGYARLKGMTPEQDNLAYEFVNALTDQNNSLNFIEYSGFGHINEVGMKKASKLTTKKASFDNLESYKSKMFVWSDVDRKIVEKATKDYERIKAGY